MAKTKIKQLDLGNNIYAAVDERGSIIGTGTKEVCEFLVQLANRDLGSVSKPESWQRATNANVRSAIEI